MIYRTTKIFQSNSIFLKCAGYNAIILGINRNCLYNSYGVVLCTDFYKVVTASIYWELTIYQILSLIYVLSYFHLQAHVVGGIITSLLLVRKQALRLSNFSTVTELLRDHVRISTPGILALYYTILPPGRLFFGSFFFKGGGGKNQLLKIAPF